MKKFLGRSLCALVTSIALLMASCSVDAGSSSDDSQSTTAASSESSGSGAGETSSPLSPSSPAATQTTTVQAEPEKTGTVSIGTSVSKVKVTFVDSNEGEDKNEDVVITLVQGQNGTARVPEWTRSSYDLSSWTSSVEGVTLNTALTQDVAFTAQWSKYFTVTFVDSAAGDIEAVADVTQKIYENADSKKATLPAFASKTNDYDLTWTSSVEGLTVESDITSDVTFTAVWTAHAHYTVNFVDNQFGNTADAQTIFEGKTATVPDWTKEHYTLTWTSSVDGLTPTSPINADVTFTAVWTEFAKYTVTFVDSAAGEIAAEANDVQSVYEGDKATLPGWVSGSKSSDYTVSWASSAEGLTPDSAITKDVTFTATWTAKPDLSTITFTSGTSAVCDNSAITATVSGNLKSGTSITCNGVTYSNCLKMEGATSIVISGASGCTVTIVADAAGKAFKVDGTKTSSKTVADGSAYTMSFTAPTADSFTIAKGDSCNIGAILISK